MEKYLDYIIDPNSSIKQYKHVRQIFRYYLYAVIAQELLVVTGFLMKYGISMDKASSATIQDKDMFTFLYFGNVFLNLASSCLGLHIV